MNPSTNASPPVKTDTALRFPLATLTQVRREVARQLGQVRHAKLLFLLALVLLVLGAYAGVLVPQLMGRIVDLVMDRTQGSLWLIGAGLISAAIAGAVVNACGFRGFDDGIRTCLGGKPGNVLRYGALKQFDVLRQITDVLAEALVRPLVQGSAVKLHLSSSGSPNADERSREAGFSRT